jgi:hypothetical protein
MARWFRTGPSVVVLGVSALLAGLLGTVAPTAASGASTKPAAGLPPGLQPTQVNVTNDPNQRYGEPEVAVNPP